MTPQDQIKAIAELDGFVKHPKHNYYYRNGDVNGERLEDSFSRIEYAPKYLTSRDAIVPVIEKQQPEIQREIAKLLISYEWNQEIMLVDVINALLKPPPQLCEALLRATGKWEETLVEQHNESSTLREGC